MPALVGRSAPGKTNTFMSVIAATFFVVEHSAESLINADLLRRCLFLHINKFTARCADHYHGTQVVGRAHMRKILLAAQTNREEDVVE